MSELEFALVGVQPGATLWTPLPSGLLPSLELMEV